MVLARAVEAQRASLNRSVDECATSAGLGRSTWRAIESGRRTRVQDDTLRKIDTGLGWSEGTAARICNGDERPVGDPNAELVLAYQASLLKAVKALATALTMAQALNDPRAA
jgi:hypothetical protein